MFSMNEIIFQVNEKFKHIQTFRQTNEKGIR